MAFKDSIPLLIAQEMSCFKEVRKDSIDDAVVGKKTVTSYTIVFLPELGLPDMTSTKLAKLVLVAIAAVTEKAIAGAKHG